MKNYEIGDIIDSGGMGVVYKGRHIGLERDVAIKFILPHVASDEQSVERFLREARLAGRINHPNVTHIYDTGVDDQGRPYIVMELLNGEPLKARLSRGPMTEGDSIEITKQVLLALEKAHSMGVIHRDIKPGNIFLTQDRMAKILDFGVAKGLDSGSGNVTLAGKTVGSPAYMSPEQAEGETVDARTDLYSVGIVLYEMLAGNVPFRGENSLAIMQKHLSTAPPPLPNGVNNTLKAVVDKALAKKVDKRFANAREMLTALEKAPIRNVVVATATPPDGAAAAGSVSGSRSGSGSTPVPGRKSTKSQETASIHSDDKKKTPWALLGIGAAVIVGLAIFGVPKLLNATKTPATTTGTTGTSGTTGTTGTTGDTTSSTTGTTGDATTGTTGTNGTTGTTGDPTTGTTGSEETRTEQKVETEPIQFEVKNEDDPSMPAGQTKVETEGVMGEREVTYDVVFRGTTEVSKTKVSERVTKEAVAKVVKNGTKAAAETTTTERTEKETIRFRTENVPSPALPKGQTRVQREGRNGVRNVTYRITMQGGKVISRVKVNTTTVQEPVNKRVLVGTAAKTSGSTTGSTVRRSWHCTECGSQYPATSAFCPKDGTRRPY